MITGAAAVYELWVSRHAKQWTSTSLNVVLGLALATVALMVFADEIGWEVNHFELHLPPKDGPYMAPGTTPETWSHVHMILNHFPTVGFVFAITFFLIALAVKNDGMTRASLVVFVICAVLGVPTYVTGAASMWALTDPPITEISKALINEHRDMALFTLFGLGFTGSAAWIELWRYRHLGRFSKTSLYLVLAVRADHAPDHGRDRTSRRPDQSSGDPVADRYPADRRQGGLDPGDRAADQQRDLVRAVADRALLRLLADFRARCCS